MDVACMPASTNVYIHVYHSTTPAPKCKESLRDANRPEGHIWTIATAPFCGFDYVAYIGQAAVYHPDGVPLPDGVSLPMRRCLITVSRAGATTWSRTWPTGRTTRAVSAAIPTSKRSSARATAAIQDGAKTQGCSAAHRAT
eukprot:1255926-Pleurochrysis_carterae.AAC.1